MPVLIRLFGRRRTQSHADQIALGGLEKKSIFQGIDKSHFSSALPETMAAVLSHIRCVQCFAEAMESRTSDWQN